MNNNKRKNTTACISFILSIALLITGIVFLTSGSNNVKEFKISSSSIVNGNLYRSITQGTSKFYYEPSQSGNYCIEVYNKNARILVKNVDKNTTISESNSYTYSSYCTKTYYLSKGYEYVISIYTDAAASVQFSYKY